MTARRTLSLGPVSVTLAGLAAGALGFAFLVAVGLRHETRSIADLALVVIALFGGAWLARLACGTGSLRVVGLVTALIAAWLLPQRNDGPSAVILAAFFGAGVGLMMGPRSLDSGPPVRRARSRTAGAVLLVAVGDAAGVKGTFFEVGHAIDKEPWITEELYRDGQGLGNHSYHHDQWRWLDPRYPELSRTQATFRKAIGVCPAFYRPPHGDRTPFVARVVNDHHMRMILWDDSSGDWAVKSPQTIARRILRGAKPGAIIVLHDGLNGNPLANRTVLVKALPLILAGLHERDLHPVRLDQLIGGPTFVPC